MRFIKVTEFDRPVFVPVDQIAFLKSKESETEIFLKNRADSLTVKEPLAEVIKNMQIVQSPAPSPSPTVSPSPAPAAPAGPPSERVFAIINSERRVRPQPAEYFDRALQQSRSRYRGPQRG